MSISFKQLKEGDYPGLGGTDISVVLGLSKYKTPLDLWEEIKGIKESFTGNLATRIGLALEAQNISEFEEETGYEVVPQYSELWDDWYRRSLDGEITNGSESYVYEGKTSLSFGAKKMWPQSDGSSESVPDYYQLQVQWYMAQPILPTSTEMYSRAYFSTLLTGPEHRIYTVERDPETCARILEFAEDWWKIHVIGDLPPEEKETDCGRGIKERISNGNLVELVEHDAIERYRAAKQCYADAKKELDKEKKSVIKIIGDNEGIRGPWGKITYKSFVSKRLNRKKLTEILADHVGPDTAKQIINQACNEVRSERFQATLKGESK